MTRINFDFDAHALREAKSRCHSSRTRTRMGIRCTTLTQLPLGVLGPAESWNSCAAAGLILSTMPSHARSG